MNVSAIRSRIMIVLVLLSLAACGAAQSQSTATARPPALLGKWRVTSMAKEGTAVSLSDVETRIIFDFAADGSVTLTDPDASEDPQKGTYTISDSGQLNLNLELTAIKGTAQFNGEQFTLTYDEPQPLDGLREVNPQGTPIDPAQPSPVMERVVMTFERVR